MEGPVRFQCPPEFEAVSPSSPPSPLGGVSLGGPKTELWLIRAPLDFRPESLEGLSVPLEGEGRLRPPTDNGDNGDNDGDKARDTSRRLYVLRGGRGGADTPLLLTPTPPSGCAPPLRGCITISQSFEPPPTPPGTPPGRKKRKRKMKEPPEVATPGEGGPGPPPTVVLGVPEGRGGVPEEPGGVPEGPGGVPEEPGGATRKKKKKKHKKERTE